MNLIVFSTSEGLTLGTMLHKAGSFFWVKTIPSPEITIHCRSSQSPEGVNFHLKQSYVVTDSEFEVWPET